MCRFIWGNLWHVYNLIIFNFAVKCRSQWDEIYNTLNTHALGIGNTNLNPSDLLRDNTTVNCEACIKTHNYPSLCGRVVSLLYSLPLLRNLKKEIGENIFYHPYKFRGFFFTHMPIMLKWPTIKLQPWGFFFFKLWNFHSPLEIEDSKVWMDLLDKHPHQGSSFCVIFPFRFP